MGERRDDEGESQDQPAESHHGRGIKSVVIATIQSSLEAINAMTDQQVKRKEG